MAYRNVVVVNGVKTELKDLDEKDRKRWEEEATKKAVEKVGYKEKTA